MTALEQKPAPVAQLDPAAQQQIAAIGGRVDGIAARQNQLGTAEQADTAKISDQIAGMDTRLTAATKAGGEISAINERQARSAQLQGAAVALAAGRPLGVIAGAPPALSQFATKAPPTEASLRLSFDAAAQSARRAGQPAAADAPFLTRLWDRAQSGVVVREGDRVLVGDAVSGVLEHSRHQLEARRPARRDFGAGRPGWPRRRGHDSLAGAGAVRDRRPLRPYRGGPPLMRGILTFLVAAIVVVGVAWWAAALPGSVSIDVGSVSLSAPTPVALLAVVLLFLVIYVVIRLALMIIRLPRRTRRMRADRDRARGETAVTRTLLALAGGDPDTARREAQRGRNLLGDTPQTLLLAAYAARQGGDVTKADEAFDQLAARKDAAFLGLRGLLQSAVARGDWAQADALAQRAGAINPSAPWLRAERERLAIRAGSWKEALSISGQGKSAALATAASDAEADPAQARRLAQQAWKADPAFAPAALAYARRLREAGREKRAHDVLRESWGKAPHPAIGEAALEGGGFMSRESRAEWLTASNPAHPESLLLRARAAADAGRIPEARTFAEAARETGMDERRLWLLFATISDREDDPDAASEALRRAANAPADPHWRCEGCGSPHAGWHPVCPVCGEAGRITWGSHSGRITPMLAADVGDGMLA